MKSIADRLLLSRACFLFNFTIVKLNQKKLKKTSKKLGLQHRRTKQEKSTCPPRTPLALAGGDSSPL
jgi:hypothetical protein